MAEGDVIGTRAGGGETQSAGQTTPGQNRVPSPAEVRRQNDRLAPLVPAAVLYIGHRDAGVVKAGRTAILARAEAEGRGESSAGRRGVGSERNGEPP